jgi:hypothetical protein
MVERLGLSADDVKRDNPCVNEGVLLGHIVLTDETTLQDVIYRGRSDMCQVWGV